MKVYSIKRVEKDIIKVRLGATKRRTFYFKIYPFNIEEGSCNDERCEFYRRCFKMRSPTKKYGHFGDFCNMIFENYPDLKSWLKENIGILDITQVVPIKNRN